MQTSGLLDRITGAWDNPAKPLAREGAMLAFAALVKQLGEAGEPYLLPLMPKLLERYADKARLSAAWGPVTCWVLTSQTDYIVYRAPSLYKIKRSQQHYIPRRVSSSAFLGSVQLLGMRHCQALMRQGLGDTHKCVPCIC